MAGYHHCGQTVAEQQRAWSREEVLCEHWYNEVVVDGDAFTAGLPHSVEAIFYVSEVPGLEEWIAGSQDITSSCLNREEEWVRGQAATTGAGPADTAAAQQWPTAGGAAGGSCGGNNRGGSGGGSNGTSQVHDLRHVMSFYSDLWRFERET